MLATYHSLLDAGYISFDNDLTVLVTHRYAELSRPLQKILDSLKGHKAQKPKKSVKNDYLKYHRKKWQFE
jgi:hypothetical protein